MNRRIVEIYGGGGVGGAAQHLRLLCRGLSERGFDVVFLSLPPHSIAEAISAMGIQTVRAGSFREALTWLSRSGRGYIRHVHGTRALLVGLAAGGVLVRTVHSFIEQDYASPWRRWPALLLDRWSFRRARLIITVSQALAVHLAHRGCPPRRIVTIHNGVTPPPPAKARETILAEAGWPEDVLLLFMAARLHPLKGVDRAVAVLPHIPSARLLVFGEGPLRDELLRQAVEYGVAERLRLAGFSPEVRAYLGGADCVLMPSRQEGLPFTAVEAMAAGVPVVATDLPGLREALGDAAVYTTGEPEDLARAVAEAVARRQELAQRGLERYRQEFSAEAFLAATEQALCTAEASTPGELRAP